MGPLRINYSLCSGLTGKAQKQRRALFSLVEETGERCKVLQMATQFTEAAEAQLYHLVPEVIMAISPQLLMLSQKALKISLKTINIKIY